MKNKPLESFDIQRKAFFKKMDTVVKKGKTKLFLIIVANTLDPSIGEGCALDVKTVRSLFVKMSEFMEFILAELVITGKDYTTKNIFDSLDKLKFGHDDIIIFYYTGHGFSFAKEVTTRTPQLDLQSFPASNKIKAIENTTKNLNEILEKIKSKGARLNIVIGDCCNDKINFNRKFKSKVAKKTLIQQPKSEVNKETCKAMFCDPKSSMLIAAADKGLLAITDDEKGSIFTLKFVEILSETIHAPLTKNKDFPWESLLKKTQASTLRLSKTFDLPDGNPGNQKSFFIIKREGFVLY